MGVHALMLTDAFLYLGDQVESASGGGSLPGPTGGGAVLFSNLFFSLGDMTGAASGGGTVDPEPTPGCTFTITDLIGDIEVKVSTEGYFKSQSRTSGPKRKIRFQVPWDVSDRLMDLLVGGNLTSVGGNISFPTPHRFPGNEKLICVSADLFTPLGPARPDPSGKLFAAGGALIDTLYEIPDLDVYGDRYSEAFDNETVPWASITERGVEEMVALSAVDEFNAPRFQYRGLGFGPTTGQIGIPVSGNIVEIRRSMIPADLYSGFQAMLMSLRGKLNDNVFCGYPRGTLRFENFDKNSREDASGAAFWEYAINLRSREIDHNMEPVESSLNQWAILEDEDGNTRFQYADFNPLKRWGVV